MKRRRAQTAGLHAVLSLIFLSIPFLVTAQQQPSADVDEFSVVQSDTSAAARPSVSLGNDEHQVQRKNTNYNTYHHHNNNNKNAASDVRALATLAPSARPQNGDDRAPPARTSGHSAGLSSRLPARSLQDWDVEDIVLMATVDGMIHARDRNTGAPRWTLANDKPMVETIYHDRNSSDDDIGEGKSSAQKFYWIVEPSQDGSLYGYTPGAPFGMGKLGLTVKQLVELSPYAADDPPVVYTGQKRNSLFTVDANTGTVLKTYPRADSRRNEQDVCRQSGTLNALDEEECEARATLTLGRTEYTVAIENSLTGEPICTINYFEWTPNNRDQDLASQYSETKDNRYIYSLHDGRVMALDHLRPSGQSLEIGQKPMYKHKFQSPVVRVFDLVRPTHSTTLDTPLIALPQPIGPALMDSTFLRDDSKVFVNCTEAGSLYALSELEYPMITDDAKPAQSSRGDWSLNTKLLDGSEEALKKAMVGVHALSWPDTWPMDVPSISGPEAPSLAPGLPGRNTAREEIVPIVELSDPNVISVKKSHLSSLLVAILALLGTLLALYWKTPMKKLDLGIQSAAQLQAVETPSVVAREAVSHDSALVSDESARSEQTLETLAPSDATIADTDEQPSVNDGLNIMTSAASVSESNKENNVPSVSNNEVKLLDKPSTNTSQIDDFAIEEAPTAKNKPKAHRGQRSGKKEKERKMLRQATQQANEIDGIVEGVKQIGQNVTVKPDGVSTASTSATQGHLDNLIFHTDKLLGTGSGGTMVYEGEFEGRSVAVKRMLTVHYELALQEVSLLEHSEDHPNVIRYYCRREDRHFLYIALELCQASLFDLYRDRYDPSAMPDARYTETIAEITRAPVKAMRQLAEGLKHLHALRIVHRDIKPQNMLVAYAKKNTTSTFPRLVISDFGLCKTLPDGASTLIGATVNAGTTGWKAPELIHQPRDASLNTGSQHSASNGSMNASGEPQPGAPGVKRAVDIFSLGCVFFYILTQGLHPFDDEEGWLALRERNIKTNRCNLSAIEIHGPDTIDLIKWMLAPKPEDRPTAAEVLAHPFFWTAEDRLEFLSLASDRFDQDLKDGKTELLDELETHAEAIIPPGPSTLSISSSGGGPPSRSNIWSLAAHKRSGSFPSSSPPTHHYNAFSAHTPPPSSTHSIALPVPEPNFLAQLDPKFIGTLAKQRKYNGAKLADLLRALRNKYHHWDEMPEDVKVKVGEVPEGYLRYWEVRFPGLVVGVWRVCRERGVGEERRFGRWFGGRI